MKAVIERLKHGLKYYKFSCQQNALSPDWAEVQKYDKAIAELQDLESYIEKQVEAHKPDEDDIQNEFWTLDNTGAGRYQAYGDILQKIRGDR